MTKLDEALQRLHDMEVGRARQDQEISDLKKYVTELESLNNRYLMIIENLTAKDK